MMNSQQTLPVGTPGVLGGMFAVWNDQCGNGISEQDVHYRSFPAIQVMAERMWKGDNQQSVPFSDFEALCKVMPEAPGVNLLARIEEKVLLTETDKEITLNGKENIETNIQEVGYPYTVSFSICPNEEENISGTLFKGPHSMVYTNWENTGRIAFTRDGYAFTFGSYILPNGEWTDICIKGDWKGTSLYVNGKLQERLEGRKKRVYNPKYNRLENMPIQETLIFPLQHIGDSINGFKGKLKNIKIVQE
jgi:hexosaminidase